MSHSGTNYNFVERLVHRLAMSQLDVQKMLSAQEDKRYQSLIEKNSAASPVFITSLPRAGTTLLLEVLMESMAFASHTYRNMPFVLCPLFWDRLSRNFHLQARSKERAHGDGMLVDYDSVEAFEEILWLSFWPEHFKADCIAPWDADSIDIEQQFAVFLRQHMRKIIQLWQQKSGSSIPLRYLSKNNANIARLGWLETHFPDATILVPFREPAAHIASLFAQHQRFMKIHETDRFALHYMKSIGHMEFGKAFRPINFNNWINNNHDLDPLNLNYWAEYWIVSYEQILATAGTGTKIISYDRLCAEPENGLSLLEQQLGLAAGNLAQMAERFRMPTSHEALTGISPKRISRLEHTFESLNKIDLLN